MFKRIVNKLFGKQISQEANNVAFRAIVKNSNAMAMRGGGTFSGSSGGSGWRGGVAYSGSIRTIDHYTMRHNARNAYLETPQAKALTDRFADTVADIGLKLDATPKASILGLSQEELSDWAENVEARYDLWARSKRQHRSETMTWYQYHRLYQIEQQRDNDQFTRLYYSQDRNLLNPLQFEAIDADQIRGDSYTSTLGGLASLDGIERDSRGRETFYNIWTQNPKTLGSVNVKIPRVGPKSKRLFMLHGYMPEFAGQGRGFSRLGHAIQKFQNLTDFELSHIKKAIAQSMVSMTVKPSADKPASNFLENMATNFGISAAGTVFDGGGDPGTAGDVTDVVPPVSCFSIPEGTVEVPGSMVVTNLNSGEELKPFEPKSPIDSYGEFVDAFTAHLTAASSMPIEVLLMRFNENYSASRATLILFWRIVQMFREEMAADLLNPTYEMWLSSEIAMGRISAPGWSDPILRAAWLCAKWVGSPMPNIDPLRTAKADEKYVELSAQTLDDVARNLNGSSGAANRAKNSRQFEALPDAPWLASNDAGEL